MATTHSFSTAFLSLLKYYRKTDVECRWDFLRSRIFNALIRQWELLCQREIVSAWLCFSCRSLASHFGKTFKIEYRVYIRNNVHSWYYIYIWIHRGFMYTVLCKIYVKASEAQTFTNSWQTISTDMPLSKWRHKLDVSTPGSNNIHFRHLRHFYASDLLFKLHYLTNMCKSAWSVLRFNIGHHAGRLNHCHLSTEDTSLNSVASMSLPVHY